MLWMDFLFYWRKVFISGNKELEFVDPFFCRKLHLKHCNLDRAQLDAIVRHCSPQLEELQIRQNSWMGKCQALQLKNLQQNYQNSWSSSDGGWFIKENDPSFYGRGLRKFSNLRKFVAPKLFSPIGNILHSISTLSRLTELDISSTPQVDLSILVALNNVSKLSKNCLLYSWNLSWTKLRWEKNAM